MHKVIYTRPFTKHNSKQNIVQQKRNKSFYNIVKSQWPFSRSFVSQLLLTFFFSDYTYRRRAVAIPLMAAHTPITPKFPTTLTMFINSTVPDVTNLLMLLFLWYCTLGREGRKSSLYRGYTSFRLPAVWVYEIFTLQL